MTSSHGLKYLSDLYELDTETMVWTRPRISGEEYPSKRLNHKSCMVGNYFVIFGGWTPKPINLLPAFIQDANEKFMKVKKVGRGPRSGSLTNVQRPLMGN